MSIQETSVGRVGSSRSNQCVSIGTSKRHPGKGLNLHAQTKLSIQETSMEWAGSSCSNQTVHLRDICGWDELDLHAQTKMNQLVLLYFCKAYWLEESLKDLKDLFVAINI